MRIVLLDPKKKHERRNALARKTRKTTKSKKLIIFCRFVLRPPIIPPEAKQLREGKAKLSDSYKTRGKNLGDLAFLLLSSSVRECTVVENSQKSGRRYWATQSSTRASHSVTCSAVFAAGLTHSLPRLWENVVLDAP